MGSYHGKQTFDTFTHQRSVFRQSTKVDVPAVPALWEKKAGTAETGTQVKEKTAYGVSHAQFFPEVLCSSCARLVRQAKCELFVNG